MPTDQSLRRWGWKLLRPRQVDNGDPFIADKTLQLADQLQLNQFAAPPACGPLYEELTLTFKDWLATENPTHRIQLVLLPPCEQGDMMRRWGELNGYSVVEPPPRAALLSRPQESLQCDNKAQMLIVPRLERWFLRHHNGLHHVQQLIDHLTTLQQHCIISCSSWAWSYLSKAMQTHLVLPTPLTFVAFDKQRLVTWLGELAESDDQQSVFRFSSNGAEVFGEKASQRASQDYFATLAARSLGIPWVAWHQWRLSLKLSPQSDQNITEKFPDERTVWISDRKEFRVPDSDASLMILQAILIHDRLTMAELDITVPGIQRSNVLASLHKLGLIEEDQQGLRCTPSAYPAIREGLSAAGFPPDPL